MHTFLAMLYISGGNIKVRWKLKRIVTAREKKINQKQGTNMATNVMRDMAHIKEYSKRNPKTYTAKELIAHISACDTHTNRL